jgi:hypothetical protein
MADDKQQLILVIVPAVAVTVLLIITAIAIIRKLRHSSQRCLLPATEKPPASFTRSHLNTLRGWEKPKTNADHIPFLAQPVPSHQPQRPAKGAWQQFKEKQQQRVVQTQPSNKPLEKWHHQPKGPAYWSEVGKEMQARRKWW